MKKYLFTSITAVALNIFFFFIACPHTTEASLEELEMQVGQEESFVPNCMLYCSGNNPKYILIVEKSTQRAYLYRGGNIDNPQGIFKCSTGKNRGAKSEKK